MAEYLVLARKYRSRTFDEVVGQEAISTTLVNAIRTGRIAHAFLFTGTRGVGKTTMARILARALNCLRFDAPTPTPCGECDACEAIGRGDDMDVIEIDGASNRGIDEIRDLRSNAVLRPARCRYKIYYIDEVHMLTKEAFNALLKTLEEPPPHVKFIFATTEVEKVPATILSRCQRFDFRNIPTIDIAGHLTAICKAEKVKITDGAVFRVAKAAAGSMRDGVSLLDQLLSSSSGKLDDDDVVRVLGTPPDERIGSLLAAVADCQPSEALTELDAILMAGFPLEGVVGALSDEFRNIMLALTCGDDSKLIELPETRRQALGQLAGRFSLPVVVHAVGVCERLGRAVRGSPSARAIAEAAIVRLAAADKFVDVASLVERLEHLGSGGATRPTGSAVAPAIKKKPVESTQGAPCNDPTTSAASRPGNEQQTSRRMDVALLPWETPWLAANWATVVERVGEIAGPRLASVLQPARVLASRAGLLRLGYDLEFEPLLRRTGAEEVQRLSEAFGRLAGQSVRCEFVATGQAATGVTAAGGPPIGGISSSDREKAVRDPAVRSIVDLFGGKITAIRPVGEGAVVHAESNWPEPTSQTALSLAGAETIEDYHEDD